MIGKRLTRHIDPQEAYTSWARAGSVYKAPLYMKNVLGKYNEKTGEPFSPQAVWNSAGYYIINNMREARVIYDDVMKANGFFPTDKDWYNFVVPKIVKLRPEDFKLFMSKNSYMEPFVTEYLNGQKQG
jgi:hypothetical protein